MRVIPLTEGKFTLVDDEDFGWLSAWNWKYQHQRGRSNSTGYARRNTRPTNMHRLILENQGPIDVRLVVDHWNGWGLDNRRQNLRAVTQSVNCRNRAIHRIDLYAALLRDLDSLVEQGLLLRLESESKLLEDRFTCVEQKRSGADWMRDLNRRVYFHRTKGWLLRTPDGEVSVANWETGMKLASA